jgi:ABC-2 type transport system permease protein
MSSTLAGTGSLIRLGLRRDRWLLPSWALGFAAMAGFSASATAGLYPDVAARIEAAEIVNSTASLVALYGRIYDPSSLGSLALFKLTGFGAALIAVLMVVVMVRHTRAEEEAGRLELLGAGVVGRNAPLVAALVLTSGASLLIGVLTALALAAGGLPATGSLAFGLGWAASGLAFSAVAAVTAQMSTGRRAAVGLGLAVVAVTYGLRAIGDLAEEGPSLLSWLSPIGWTQQVRAYAGDRWWVLLLPLGLWAALVPVAFALRARRDLGSGLLSDRPGPARGSLTGVGGLAVRLHRGVLVAWAVGFVGFGLLLGSLATSVSGFVTSPGFQDIIRRLGGEQTLINAFLAAELGILGIIVTAYGLTTAQHLRTEETAGHAEPLLATATTRSRWATSHVAVAAGGVALLMLLTGLAVGTGYAIDVGDVGALGDIVVAALARVPAAWVVVSLALAVFGWAPRLTGLVWGAYVAFIAIGEFGVLWDAPQWLMDLSPFVHSPRLPVNSSAALLPVTALTAVAAALTVVGYVGWRRRDLAP